MNALQVLPNPNNDGVTDFKTYLENSLRNPFTLNLEGRSLLEVVNTCAMVKSKTHPGYKENLAGLVYNLQILEGMYHTTLQPIQVTDIFWNYFTIFCKQRGLKASTIHTICCQLRSILSWAIKHNAEVEKIWKCFAMGKIDVSYARVGFTYNGRAVLDYSAFIDLLLNYGFKIEDVLTFIDEFADISENEDNTNLPVLMGSDITLKKTFVANQWNTLCLPFALSAEQLTSLFGEDSRVAALSNIDASTSSFYFSSITTGTEAGKPYLVFPTKDINDPIELTGIDLVCEDATSESNEGFAFCGLLAPMSTTADGKTFYLLGDNYNLKKATEEENMPALGAYFTVPEETTDALLFIDNISTDIRTVGNQKLHDNIQSFDLQGRHVNMSQTKKGIYIKSGKKFVK